MSVPSELSFPKLRQAAIAAVATSYKCTPSNSGTSWAPSSILQFDLPAGLRSTHLDPAQTYLMFTATPTLTAGTSATWQAKPWSFIKQIQLYSSAGSNLLETTGEYAALWEILRNTGSTEDHARASDTITMGIDAGRPRMALKQNSGVSMTYAIPLTSILGLSTAGQLYLPTHALSSPLRLELTLNSAAAALACAGTPTAVSYTVTNPYLSCGLITVSDLAQQQLNQMVASSSGGAYNFNSSVWRNYRNVHAANQMSDSLLIPARFSSLKGMITIMRESASLESKDAYSVDCIRAQLASYQLKVGSSYVNPQPVNCTGNAVEAFMELKKVFCSLTNQAMPTLISLADWTNDASTTVSDTDSAGAFMLGFELEPWSNNKLLTGTSTIGSNMYLDLAFAANHPALTIDSFVEADSLFSIANGQMTVSF